MTDFDTMLTELQSFRPIQKKISWDECIPDEMYEKYFKSEHKRVASGLYVDKHRHYETSVEVLQFGDRFLGIESITDVFSEQSEVEDCFHRIEFFEMFQELKPTYTRKNK